MRAVDTTAPVAWARDAPDERQKRTARPRLELIANWQSRHRRLQSPAVDNSAIIGNDWQGFNLTKI